MEKDDKEKTFVNHNRGNNKTSSRSVHYKVDKARGGRRRADRHTHHRRRQIMKSAIKHEIEDYVLPSSSSGSHARGKGGFRGAPPFVAQSKGIYGPRNQFYLQPRNGKHRKKSKRPLPASIACPIL